MDNPRGTVRHLAGFDTTLGFDDCPVPGFELEPRVRRTVSELETLDGRIAAIKKNPSLSQRGRDDALAALAADCAKVAKEVTKLDEVADTLVATNAMAAGMLFEPPALDPTDHNGRLDDAEIRQWVKELVGDQRQRVLNAVVAGKEPRIALALARAPVPTVEREMGQAALQASMSDSDRANHREIDAQRAALEWTKSVTSALRNILARHDRGATA